MRLFQVKKLFQFSFSIQFIYAVAAVEAMETIKNNLWYVNRAKY